MQDTATNVSGRFIGPRSAIAVAVASAVLLALGGCTSSPSPPHSPVARAPTATAHAVTPLPPRAELLRGGGVGVIEVAFNRIVDEHVTPVDTAALLSAAWDGVRKAADAGGFAQPAQPSFSGDRASDFATFRSAYASLSPNLRSSPLTRFTAISAMARSLNDCHTFFIGPSADASDRETFNDAPLSDFGMTLSGRPPVVTETESFSPASTAGLRAGDTLVSIDGEDAAGKGPLDALIQIAEGEQDTNVELRVRRPGAIEDVTILLKRAYYVPPNVQSSVLNHDVGYVRIRQWTGPGLASQLQTILTRFHKDKIAKWIIDLRGNPGGVLDDEALSLFVGDGVIVRSRERDGAVRETQASGNVLENIAPTVLLVDDGSASMSEEFALTLQEYGLAHLIGTKTYGCIGQTFVSGLGDGSGLAVTFGLIQGPKTRVELNGVGITPDETVERTTDDIIAKRDPQLDAAIAYLAR